MEYLQPAYKVFILSHMNYPMAQINLHQHPVSQSGSLADTGKPINRRGSILLSHHCSPVKLELLRSHHCKQSSLIELTSTNCSKTLLKSCTLVAITTTCSDRLMTQSYWVNPLVKQAFQQGWLPYGSLAGMLRWLCVQCQRRPAVQVKSGGKAG